MTELNTATPAASEQPQEGPSQPSPVAESSPEPVGAVSTQEKAPEVDLEAIRQKVYEEAREKARHEVQSEYGKRLSEQKRQAEEKVRQERERFLSSLSDFLPDTQLEAYRQQYAADQQAQQQAQQTEQALAENAYYRRQAQEQDLIRKAGVLIEQAGYKFEDLPADVRGDSVEGFADRFLPFVAKELQKAKKETEKAVKKAADEATRETERKLGVTHVSGGAPVGSGKSDLATLQAKHRDAVDRNDRAKIAEYGRLIEEEVYRGR